MPILQGFLNKKDENTLSWVIFKFEQWYKIIFYKLF